MNINFSDLTKTVDQIKNHRNFIESFIKELEKGINHMDNNIKQYTIDRFEDNIAVCEDRETRETINVKIEELPKEAREGSILDYKDGKFFINKEQEKKIEQRIKQKMDNLWKN